MSRIKFKAWDTKDKIMFDYNHIMQTAFSDNHLLYKILSDDRYIKLRYTEFDDMNDNPIYDGDIYEEVDSQSDDVFLGTVNYLSFLRNTTNSTIRRMRVIGNIYENANILKR
jgi:hypothetical protein